MSNTREIIRRGVIKAVTIFSIFLLISLLMMWVIGLESVMIIVAGASIGFLLISEEKGKSHHLVIEPHPREHEKRCGCLSKRSLSLTKRDRLVIFSSKLETISKEKFVRAISLRRDVFQKLLVMFVEVAGVFKQEDCGLNVLFELDQDQSLANIKTYLGKASSVCKTRVAKIDKAFKGLMNDCLAKLSDHENDLAAFQRSLYEKATRDVPEGELEGLEEEFFEKVINGGENLASLLSKNANAFFSEHVEKVKIEFMELPQPKKARSSGSEEHLKLFARKSFLINQTEELLNKMKVMLSSKLPESIVKLDRSLSFFQQNLETLSEYLSKITKEVCEIIADPGYYIQVLTIVNTNISLVKTLRVFLDHIHSKPPSEVEGKGLIFFDNIKSSLWHIFDIFEVPFRPDFLQVETKSEFLCERVVHNFKNLHEDILEEKLSANFLNQVFSITFLEWSRSPGFQVR